MDTQAERTSWPAPAARHAHEGVEAAAALAEENRQLRDALQTRGVIEQAKGVLMAQRRCGPQEAFDVLVTLSQDTNVKLRDVAQAFVDEFLATVPAESRGGPAAPA
ncbi:ANTAR domain-containing protein [Amycolatopsis carbonis]|uniref:ANTAR domain-containing protein n=1 Tax=Amycolatopsis carbonis TaxID=715471 RepID=A0A9Y2IPL8_9PSEU|nr:ANTAR domain-containing protein [Amycolatopsis sp. 2-15]WIX82836.1 ANTAR domain-containing protein [Amycolatopsis sp. 2-15]